MPLSSVSAAYVRYFERRLDHVIAKTAALRTCPCLRVSYCPPIAT